MSGTKIASAASSAARKLAASPDRHLGIAGADRQRGLDQADIGDRGGDDELLLRQLRDERRRQDDEVGRRAVAQFVGHGADRAELAGDVEAGLAP